MALAGHLRDLTAYPTFPDALPTPLSVSERQRSMASEDLAFSFDRQWGHTANEDLLESLGRYYDLPSVRRRHSRLYCGFTSCTTTASIRATLDIPF